MGDKSAPINDLKKVRNSRGITQEVLAAKLGVRPASIAMLENNKRGASVNLVIQLMDVLCCKFEDLYPEAKVKKFSTSKVTEAAGQQEFV
jgi:putative transcriptional regulator